MVTYSRENIRRQLLELLNDIFKNKGYKLDLSDTSFGIFLVNFMSALSADILVMSNFLYGESSLITAQTLPSVINWASYIDYETERGKSAICQLQIWLPIENSFICELVPYETYFYSGSIQFTPTSGIRIENDGSNIKIKMINENTGEYTLLPYETSIGIDGKEYIVTTIEVKNEYIKQYLTKVPVLREYEFFDIPINLNENETLIGSSVVIDNEKWEEGRLIFSNAESKVYEVMFTSGTIYFKFGNGIYGKQVNGENIIISMILSDGKEGNVQSKSITRGTTLHNLNGGGIVDYYVVNPYNAEGGKDYETIEEIKKNAPISLRTRHRLVSYQDFIDLIENFSPLISNAKIFLKRSDIKANDIDIYLLVKDPDDKHPFAKTSTICVKKTNGSFMTIYPYLTSLTSYDSLDSGTKWLSPYLIVADSYSWRAYLFEENKEINVREMPYYFINQNDYQYLNLQSFECSLKLVTINYIPEEEKLLINFFIYKKSTPSIDIGAILKLRGRNFYGELTLFNKELYAENIYVYTFVYEYSISNIMKINQFDLNLFESSTGLLVAAFSDDILLISQEVTYGPIYETSTHEELLVDVPVIEKDYYENLTNKDKLKNLIYGLYSTISSVNAKKLINTALNIRFVRTVGKLRNINLSRPNDYVKAVINEKNELNNMELNIGDKIAISDPICETSEWFDKAGNIAVYIGSDNGEKLFSFYKVGQGYYISDGNNIYTLVETRWQPINLYTGKEIELEIYSNLPNINIEVENKYKEKIIDFINNREPESTIRFSELIHYLQSLSGVSFVRLINPRYDIVYNYSIYDIKSDNLALQLYAPEMFYIEDVKITLYKV